MAIRDIVRGQFGHESREDVRVSEEVVECDGGCCRSGFGAGVNGRDCQADNRGWGEEFGLTDASLEEAVEDIVMDTDSAFGLAVLDLSDGQTSKGGGCGFGSSGPGVLVNDAFQPWDGKVAIPVSEALPCALQGIVHVLLLGHGSLVFTECNSSHCIESEIVQPRSEINIGTLCAKV